MRTSSLLAALFIFGAPAVDAQTSKSKEVRIAYLADLSGPAASIGVQSVAGAELAVDELKEQGINVTLLIEDHRNDGKTAVAAAIKTLATRAAQAIACDLTPGSSAIAPLMSKYNKLFFYQAPALSPIESYPFAFRNFLDYEVGCRMVAAHWQKTGIKNIGHLKLNYEFGELCLKGSRSIYPEQEVVDYNSGDDLRSALTRLQTNHVEAFLQTAYEPDVLNTLRVQSDLRYSPMVGIPTIYLTSAVKRSGGSMLNKYTAFGFPPIQDSFIQKLLARKPNLSLVNVQSAVIAYQHVMLAAKAIAECGSDVNCQAQKVAAAPADPLMGFLGWKDRSAQYTYRLYDLQDGDFNLIQ